jgi:hypothetical protein
VIGADKQNLISICFSDTNHSNYATFLDCDLRIAQIEEASLFRHHLKHTAEEYASLYILDSNANLKTSQFMRLKDAS